MNTVRANSTPLITRSRPHHGGRLRLAARQYGIALAEWLDLSTGISPTAYPVPPIPPEVWARLPEDDDGLEDAASRYYGTPHILPVAGSQAAIQALPAILQGERIGIVGPSYAEHEHAWRGPNTCEISLEHLDSAAEHCDIVVIVNPDNPSGHQISAQRLLAVHAKLAHRGGWLIVDEAFADPCPELSLAHHAGVEGLIVLRSLGKFFGLAGARVGFVLAPPRQRRALQNLLGPWTLSGPAREVARIALLDSAWQAAQRLHLAKQSTRLSQLLLSAGFVEESGCALFRQALTPAAARWHAQLASQGILVRLFDDPARLRFGLPATDHDFQRLANALQNIKDNMIS